MHRDCAAHGNQTVQDRRSAVALYPAEQARSGRMQSSQSHEPAPEIETTSSTVVYQNRWMTVRENRIKWPDGTPGVYGIVEKRDFAVIAPVQDGMIHLVQQYRYPVKGRYWELPQGSWETQEVPPAELAAAELREETGLTAQKMVHAGHLFLAAAYSTQGYDVFLATGLQQGAAEREHEEQGLVTAAFRLPEFEEMICNGTVKDATTVAAFALLKAKGLL